MPRRSLTDRPHILPFHIGDWRKDPGVRMLNCFEKGVWLECMIFMHECRPRGRAIVNGRPLTPLELATAVCGLDTPESVRLAIVHIVELGVASVDDAGAIFSRRIVRDNERREISLRNGKKGGNPQLKNPETTVLVNQTEILVNQLGYPPGLPDLPVPKEKASPDGEAKKKRPTRVERGLRTEYPTTIPEDWQPDPSDVTAILESCPDLDIDREIRLMRNHFLAAADPRTAKKKDWGLTLVNWCERASKERSNGKSRFESAEERKDRKFEERVIKLAGARLFGEQPQLPPRKNHRALASGAEHRGTD